MSYQFFIRLFLKTMLVVLLPQCNTEKQLLCSFQVLFILRQAFFSFFSKIARMQLKMDRGCYRYSFKSLSRKGDLEFNYEDPSELMFK